MPQSPKTCTKNSFSFIDHFLHIVIYLCFIPYRIVKGRLACISVHIFSEVSMKYKCLFSIISQVSCLSFLAHSSHRILLVARGAWSKWQCGLPSLHHIWCLIPIFSLDKKLPFQINGIREALYMCFPLSWILQFKNPTPSLRVLGIWQDSTYLSIYFTSSCEPAFSQKTLWWEYSSKVV